MSPLHPDPKLRQQRAKVSHHVHHAKDSRWVVIGPVDHQVRLTAKREEAQMRGHQRWPGMPDQGIFADQSSRTDQGFSKSVSRLRAVVSNPFDSRAKVNGRSQRDHRGPRGAQWFSAALAMISVRSGSSS